MKRNGDNNEKRDRGAGGDGAGGFEPPRFLVT